MNAFMSDNVTGVSEPVMEAIRQANQGVASSYAEDEWTARLQKRFCELFETECRVFPVASGTAANALALGAVTPPYGSIYCHRLSHINTDECGAPEMFTAGGKLIGLEGKGVKLTAQTLDASISGAGSVHCVQPACVSFAQAAESGMVYSLDEIQALTQVAHRHNLVAHMDGARFANALVRLDASPADMTWRAGVDLLSFGGTKNGCLAAEAVVVFKPEIASNITLLRKRSGHLLSKMRFISAQLLAYVDNSLWLDNARNANAMATRLSDGLSALNGIDIAYPTQANEVFARFDANLVARLADADVALNEGELDGAAIRLVTAWNTTTSQVDDFLKVVSTHAL